MLNIQSDNIVTIDTNSTPKFAMVIGLCKMFQLHDNGGMLLAADILDRNHYDFHRAVIALGNHGNA